MPLERPDRDVAAPRSDSPKADAMMAAMRYGEQLAAEPLQIAMTRTQQMAGVWLIALHAGALRVVSGLTVGGTWAAGIVLAVLFIFWLPTSSAPKVVMRAEYPPPWEMCERLHAGEYHPHPAQARAAA